jgi:hypothetical protein
LKVEIKNWCTYRKWELVHEVVWTGGVGFLTSVIAEIQWPSGLFPVHIIDFKDGVRKEIGSCSSII